MAPASQAYERKLDARDRTAFGRVVDGFSVWRHPHEAYFEVRRGRGGALVRRMSNRDAAWALCELLRNAYVMGRTDAAGNGGADQ